MLFLFRRIYSKPHKKVTRKLRLTILTDALLETIHTGPAIKSIVKLIDLHDCVFVTIGTESQNDLKLTYKLDHRWIVCTTIAGRDAIVRHLDSDLCCASFSQIEAVLKAVI